MNLNNVQNWSIADGTVVRVEDSTGDIIWEKKYNVWIADLTNIGFLGQQYVASKYAVKDKDGFIAFSTKNHPNDSGLTEIMRPTHIDGAKLKFENISGNTPGTLELVVDEYILPANKYSYYDSIKSGLQSGTINSASKYNEQKGFVKAVATTSVEDENTADPSRLYFTQDSILYIFAKISAANVTWDAPEEYTYPQEGGSLLDVTISDPDNKGWTLEAPSWIDFDGGIHEGIGNGATYITVLENTSSSRSGYVYLKSADGNIIYKTLKINQVGINHGPATAPSWNINYSGNTITSSATTIPITITDTKNVGWKITSSVNWITPKNTTGSGNKTTEVNVSKNTGSSRSGSISLYRTDTNAQVATDSFTQDSRGKLTWSETEDPITLLATDPSVILSFTATNPGTISVSSSASWCEAIYSSASNSVGCAISENTSDTDRTAIITLSGTNADPITKTLIQTGTSINPFTWDMVGELLWEAADSEILTSAGVTNGTTDWYRSTIEGESSASQIITLNITATSNCTMVIDYFSDAESNYDYLMATKLDESENLTFSTTYNSSIVDVCTRGKQGFSNVIHKIYHLTKGSHSIQIMYRKDGSNDVRTDSGYFRVYWSDE